jgi:large subunit ribosomal protein L23
MKLNIYKEPYMLILAPILSERSMDLVNNKNTYVFKVHPDANKDAIKRAIEKIFEVKVDSVNTANRKGKPRRLRMRAGYRADWKKAYVRLAQDSKIDLI